MDALEADVRDALTRFAHDAPATLARPSVIAAARSRRRRLAATVTTGTAVVLVAVAAAGFTWALPGQGQDRLQPDRTAQAPAVEPPCVDRPPPPVNADGSITEPSPGTGMAERVWDEVVAEAPVPPSGPRPALSGERVVFGTYQPTQHGYATNTDIPLPASVPLFMISGQSLCDPSHLAGLGEAEGTDEGWPAGVQVVVIDGRPSFYQLLLHHGDTAVTFETDNMETGAPVQQLRDWAMRVAGRLAVDAASGSSVPSAEATGKPATTAGPCPEPSPKDEAGLVGVSEGAAAERVEAEGLVFRVVCRDGLALKGTADARGDRVNAGVEDGVVTFSSRG